MKQLNLFIELTRLKRPIGYMLLFWPCAWGLTLAYDFSNSLLNQTKVLTAAKFYVTMRNIWTLTNYSGPDPEVDTNVSLGANPNTSQVSVGLNLQF